MTSNIKQIKVWFGWVEQLISTKDSNVLSQLPVGVYPDPEPACATCPGKDWYLTAQGLRCYCTARGVISWVSNNDPVMACDARERLIKTAELRAHADGEV